MKPLKQAILRSDLIQAIADKNSQLQSIDVELSVKTIIEEMAIALTRGDRIEIRGFGSFSLSELPARIGRNPKTGQSVALPVRYKPHFKPGKELRERVNENYLKSLEAE